MISRIVIAVWVASSGWLMEAAAGELELAPLKDNTLYEDAGGTRSNGAGAYFFVGKNSQGSLRRALLAFDLEAQIPRQARIDSVHLILHLSRTSSGAQSLSLRRVLKDWGEGASDAPGQEGGGAPSMPGDATWVHTFFDRERWASPGGDFSERLSASTEVNEEGFYTWGSTPQLVADVQAWLEDPGSNFGWILSAGAVDPGSTKRFDSRQLPEEAQRPRLRISFSPGNTAVEAQTWGEVKRRGGQ